MALSIFLLAARAPAAQNPRDTYDALNALRVDSSQVYSVHNLSLRKEGVAFTFTNGKLAFLEPLGGRVTGAVFLGSGRVFALPGDFAERASLARYLKVPLLDLDIWQAYLRFDDDTARELRRDLAAEESLPTSDPVFARSWDTIASKLNPSSSLRILEDWLSADPQPYFYAALNNRAIGPFDVFIDRRRPEPVLIGQPREARGTRFFDVWTSYAPGRTPAIKPSFSPLDYTIETTIGDDLSLTGNATLHLQTLRGGEQILGLELSRFLRVDSVTDAKGRPLVFFQNEELRRQEIARRGNNSLAVVLPEQAVTGQRFLLRIAYRGTVIGDAGNGVYFVGARGSWYPHLAGPVQFAPFDLTFRWPKQLTLVATGVERSKQEDGAMRVGHWVTTAPAAFAGFNLGQYARQAVAGNPAIELFANQQLEDAIVARLRENAVSLPPIPTDNWPPRSPLIAPPAPPLPNPAVVLKQLGGELLDSVHFFETLDGPFPFPRLDVSQIPGSFGQGWPGLLYLSTLVFLPPGAQQQAGVAVRARQQIRELMPFHEVVHQWWGNVVAPASYRDAWLEEAMANYQALLYDDHRKPSKHPLETWLERYRAALLAKQPGSGAPVEEAGPLDFGYRLDSSKTPDAYNTIIYDKGTWVIHMLRMMLRDPKAKNPDARFDELVRSVLDQYRFQALSNAEFELAVEHAMNPAMDLEGDHSMDWFFDEWVRETGIPEYRVMFWVRPRPRGFLIRGALVQARVPGLFTEVVPLYAAPRRGKPVRLGSVVTTGPKTNFLFFARRRPARILIDPEHTILCQTK